MGTSFVAEAAACSGEVALARIRSTFSDKNPLMMEEQLAASPEAFCSSKRTRSPNASVSASRNPLVAASRASCWAS